MTDFVGQGVTEQPIFGGIAFSRQYQNIAIENGHGASTPRRSDVRCPSANLRNPGLIIEFFGNCGRHRR